MTKGSEYIAGVIEQITADEQQAPVHHQGAFLAAALSIISAVESPLKERALVSLASLAIRHHAEVLRNGRKAA
jgi:hypothetical protein